MKPCSASGGTRPRRASPPFMAGGRTARVSRERVGYMRIPKMACMHHFITPAPDGSQPRNPRFGRRDGTRGGAAEGEADDDRCSSDSESPPGSRRSVQYRRRHSPGGDLRQLRPAVDSAVRGWGASSVADAVAAGGVGAGWAVAEELAAKVITSLGAGKLRWWPWARGCGAAPPEGRVFAMTCACSVQGVDGVCLLDLRRPAVRPHLDGQARMNRVRRSVQFRVPQPRGGAGFE